MAFKGDILPESIKNPIKKIVSKDGLNSLEVDKWEVENTLKKRAPGERPGVLIISLVESDEDLIAYQNLIKTMTLFFCRKCQTEYLCFSSLPQEKFEPLFQPSFGIENMFTLVLRTDKSEWIKHIRDDFDYVFYMAPYLRAVAETRFEKMTNFDGYVFVNHSWYYDGIGEPCRNYKSKSYISTKVDSFHYVNDWMFGARPKNFKHLLQSCIDMMNEDMRCRIIPDLGWESYINKFAFENRENSIFLDEGYGATKGCTTEQEHKFVWTGDVPEFVADSYKNTRSVVTVESKLRTRAKIRKNLQKKEDDLAKEPIPKRKKTIDEELADMSAMTYQELMSDKWKNIK